MKQEIFRNIWGVPQKYDLTYFYEKDEDLIEMYYSNTSQGEKGYLFLTHTKSQLPKFSTVVDLDNYFQNDNLYVVYDYIIDRFLRESED